MNSFSPYQLQQPDPAIQARGLLSRRLELYEQRRPEIVGTLECGLEIVVIGDPGAQLISSDPYAQKEPADAANRQLISLRRSYTLVSDDELIADVLHEVPALYSLLKEAVKPLQEAFDESVILRLDALTSEEDVTLRVVVKTASGTADDAARIRKFKRNWWLKNIARSRASLIFDYE
jgi:hypothetical protein